MSAGGFKQASSLSFLKTTWSYLPSIEHFSVLDWLFAFNKLWMISSVADMKGSSDDSVAPQLGTYSHLISQN